MRAFSITAGKVNIRPKHKERRKFPVNNLIIKKSQIQTNVGGWKESLAGFAFRACG